MQLPPGRSLLDWRCVKDTSPAALVDYMAKWKVVYTSFLWFCSASYAPVPVPTGAALVGPCLAGHSCRVGLDAMFMLSCCVYLLSMTHVRVGAGSIVCVES